MDNITSERWLSHYKVVYKYEVGVPVLKGAGGNVLPTRGMEIWNVGKIKVIMRKVVICALDLNVLSTESNGFELLRLIRKEFSLMSRTEALELPRDVFEVPCEENRPSFGHYPES